jgi:E3 ubiquitin-protein ligase BIG BROTHER-like protein
MDDNNTKLGSGDSKDNTNSELQLEENPNLSSNGEQQQQQGGGGGGGEGEGEGEREGGGPQSQTSGRTPFTNLSQVDADLALARTLQEQVSFFFSMFLSFFIEMDSFLSFLGLYNLWVLVVF